MEHQKSTPTELAAMVVEIHTGYLSGASSMVGLGTNDLAEVNVCHQLPQEQFVVSGFRTPLHCVQVVLPCNLLVALSPAATPLLEKIVQLFLTGALRTSLGCCDARTGRRRQKIDTTGEADVP